MDRTPSEYATTMEECPWPGLKWGSEFKDEAMDVVDPKGNHPSIFVLNGRTGKVIPRENGEEDAFEKFDLDKTEGKMKFYEYFMSKA